MRATTLLLGLLKTARLEKAARREDSLLTRDDVLQKLSKLHARRRKPCCS